MTTERKTGHYGDASQCLCYYEHPVYLYCLYDGRPRYEHTSEAVKAGTP